MRVFLTSVNSRNSKQPIFAVAGYDGHGLVFTEALTLLATHSIATDPLGGPLSDLCKALLKCDPDCYKSLVNIDFTDE